MYTTPYPISWITFILGSEPSYTDKLLEFRWVQILADLFLYCYEKYDINHDNQADIIETFNLTTTYFDDLLNIDSPYFEDMVNQIYSPELQLNKANTTDTESNHRGTRNRCN